MNKELTIINKALIKDIAKLEEDKEYNAELCCAKDIEIEKLKGIREQRDKVLRQNIDLTIEIDNLKEELAKVESEKIDLIALLETITDAYPAITKWKVYKHIMGTYESSLQQ